MIRHQYEISALLSQPSFRGETRVNVTKCRLFSRTRFVLPELNYGFIWWFVLVSNNDQSAVKVERACNAYLTTGKIINFPSEAFR